MKNVIFQSLFNLDVSIETADSSYTPDIRKIDGIDHLALPGEVLKDKVRENLKSDEAIKGLEKYIKISDAISVGKLNLAVDSIAAEESDWGIDMREMSCVAPFLSSVSVDFEGLKASGISKDGLHELLSRVIFAPMLWGRSHSGKSTVWSVMGSLKGVFIEASDDKSDSLYEKALGEGCDEGVKALRCLADKTTDNSRYVMLESLYDEEAPKFADAGVKILGSLKEFHKLVDKLVGEDA